MKSEPSNHDAEVRAVVSELIPHALDHQVPVNDGDDPPLTADYPLARKDQRTARGLRLYETFVSG